MDLKAKEIFKLNNKNKKWKDKCNNCCVLICDLFGDFKKQCHCDNFNNKNCKECKHKDLSF